MNKEKVLELDSTATHDCPGREVSCPSGTRPCRCCRDHLTGALPSALSGQPQLGLAEGWPAVIDWGLVAWLPGCSFRSGYNLMATQARMQFTIYGGY